MNKELVKEAERLGINASMYYLMPARVREKALRLDIEKRRKEEKDGYLKSQENRRGKS